MASALLAALLLVLAALLILLCVYVPALIALRVLGAGGEIALGLAPAVGAGIAGLGAIAAGRLGVPWSLPTFLALGALVILIAAGLRRLGVRIPGGTRGIADADGDADADGRAGGSTGTVVAGRGLFSGMPRGRWWVAGAGLLAVLPIALAFGRADAILERWDTLYHLNALQRVRLTGDGSSLTLGTISSTTGRTATYPAAFHDLSALVPGVPTPILLNAAALALSTVPWVLGIALLAKALWPQHRWGPAAAAILALLAPATPLDEWVHLSPLPNLTGMAMLPGVLAAAVHLWRRLLVRFDGPTDPGGAHAAPRGRRREVLADTLALAAAGTGLALLHPNCAVMALILLAVMTGTTGLPRWRRRPLLALVPLALLVPVGLLTWTPLAKMVTGFVGGLQVSWWRGLGEILLGMPTVWPMAIGVVIALAWWPGLIVSLREGTRWVSIAWLVVAILYLDAAVDSPLNLSVLFYRGQDRLSLPLTMLCCLLAVPGLSAWSGVLGRHRGERSRTLVTALTLVAVLVAGTSVPAKLGQARKNAALEYPGRPRFLQADELEGFAAAGLDPSAQVLASPFSGAAHLYGMTGQNVRFPVAGMTLSPEDRSVINAVRTAGEDPRACRVLEDAGVRYLYQEWTPYASDPWYIRLNRGGDGIGPVLFTTSHSRLIEVDCAG